MLLNSVILILREVLEAAILVCVLLALSRSLRIGPRWFWYSLPLGLLGTVIVAYNLDGITDALDGAGQEVVNATLQSVVYCLTVAIVWFSFKEQQARVSAKVLTPLMAVAVGCAMTREGSEMLIYIKGFAAVEEQRTAVYAGSAIGAGIGLSLGVLLYSALGALRDSRTIASCAMLLALIGSGMVMQAVMLLEQVDWLPAGQAIWDTSDLISEQSITGELLYAVFGYESTPGVLHVTLYILSIGITAVVYYLSRYRGRHVDLR
ncbi:MAG: high-affinity iron transporter [Halioglobus sp.]|jgi:high-affinity iron transporter